MRRFRANKGKKGKEVVTSQTKTVATVTKTEKKERELHKPESPISLIPQITDAEVHGNAVRSGFFDMIDSITIESLPDNPVFNQLTPGLLLVIKYLLKTEYSLLFQMVSKSASSLIKEAIVKIPLILVKVKRESFREEYDRADTEVERLASLLPFPDCSTMEYPKISSYSELVANHQELRAQTDGDYKKFLCNLHITDGLLQEYCIKAKELYLSSYAAYFDRANEHTMRLVDAANSAGFDLNKELIDGVRTHFVNIVATEKERFIGFLAQRIYWQKIKYPESVGFLDDAIEKLTRLRLQPKQSTFHYYVSGMQVEFNKDDYVICGSDDANYLGFGVTKQEARELLKGRLNRTSVLRPLLSAVLNISFDGYVAETELKERIAKKLEDNSLFGDEGTFWSHIAILHALAYALNIEINFWVRKENDVIVRYECPERYDWSFGRRLDLLVADRNQIERLEIGFYSDDYAEKRDKTVVVEPQVIADAIKQLGSPDFKLTPGYEEFDPTEEVKGVVAQANELNRHEEELNKKRFEELKRIQKYVKGTLTRAQDLLNNSGVVSDATAFSVDEGQLQSVKQSYSNLENKAIQKGPEFSSFSLALLSKEAHELEASAKAFAEAMGGSDYEELPESTNVSSQLVLLERKLECTVYEQQDSYLKQQLNAAPRINALVDVIIAGNNFLQKRRGMFGSHSYAYSNPANQAKVLSYIREQLENDMDCGDLTLEEHYVLYYLGQRFNRLSTKDGLLLKVNNSEWQKMLPSLQEAAWVKLQKDIKELDFSQQVELLRQAREEPLFKLHIQNYTVTRGLGFIAPKYLAKIDGLLSNLEGSQALQYKPRG